MENIVWFIKLFHGAQSVCWVGWIVFKAVDFVFGFIDRQRRSSYYLAMKLCESCAMADKIYECCGRYPETGATVEFLLDDNRYARACPYLDHDGRCRIYEHRPAGCRMHSCQTVFQHSFLSERWELMETMNSVRDEE